MSKLLVLFRDGALLDSSGTLVPGVVPALIEMQQSGFKMAVVTPSEQINFSAAESAAPNPVTAKSLTTAQVLSVLASQGVEIAHNCEIDTNDSTAISGQLAPWLLTHSASTEDSIVAAGSAMAVELASHLGFKAFSPVQNDHDDHSADDAASSTGYTKADWPAFASQICQQPRTAVVVRNSNETAIRVAVDLDSPQRSIAIDTGIGFFDHMVEQVAKHGGFSLQLECKGDLHIDEHHTVEDCALALGQALREALGDKHGIGRYGFVLPMDEAEVQVSMDLSARPYFVFNGGFTREHVGELTTEMVPHFFKSLSDTLGASLHITMSGDNAHHQVEVIFKGVGRTLRQALARAGNELPSTKGML